jgi:hypothetical protein
MILKFFILASLEITFQLGCLDGLMVALGARPFNYFMMYLHSLVLTGMFVWPTNLESLSLIGKSTS